MRPLVAARARALGKSVTALLPERAAVLRSQGRTVFDLAQGEAGDRFTPEDVKEAARRAIRDNRTRYTPPGGIPELKAAAALRFWRDNGLSVSPAQVVAGAGAKQCIFSFLMAVLEPGDEVLIPVPYWVSYVSQVQLAGGRPVAVPAAAPDFKLTADLLRSMITPFTRVLILNNPNNPAGAVYTRAELLDILAVVLEAGLLVLADEVYDRLTYDGAEHTCFATLAPEAAPVTVTVNSVSKTYCMTGWRIGFAAGPHELIAAMESMQSHSAGCPNAVAQWAAVAALTGGGSEVEVLRRELDDRRRMVMSAIQEMPGLTCFLPQGAFYVFPAVTGYPNPAEFASDLLEATGVMVVPGAAFGAAGHVRICFAAARAALEEALARTSAWLERLEV
jgi:aspartate aminotransferase